MTDYLLPHFGLINFTALNEEYDTVIELDGKKIRIDIHFDKTTIEKAEIDIIKNFIESINKFDKKNMGFIEKDFNNENGYRVKEYIDYHIDEVLEKEKLTQLIDYDNREITPEKQLLNKLILERVGLYPDGKYEESFAVFDYTLEGNVYIDSRRITDEILVVRTDKNGNLDNMSCES